MSSSKRRLVPFHPRSSLVLAPLGALVGAAILLGCGSTAVPEAEVAETPAVESEPEPEAPLVKPCKTLDEACVADGDAQARIAQTELVFIPPTGWLYAQEDEVSIAQTEDGNGAVAMKGYEAATNPKDKETRTRREEAMEQLLGALGVKLPERFKRRVTPNWDRPDATDKVGEYTLAMWQINDATRGSKTGAVLFFATSAGESTALLGLGFAPKGDDTADEAILEALKTIGPGSLQ